MSSKNSKHCRDTYLVLCSLASWVLLLLFTPWFLPPPFILSVAAPNHFISLIEVLGRISKYFKGQRIQQKSGNKGWCLEEKHTGLVTSSSPCPPTPNIQNIALGLLLVTASPGPFRVCLWMNQLCVSLSHPLLCLLMLSPSTASSGNMFH